jgi:predicted amidohydrolase
MKEHAHQIKYGVAAIQFDPVMFEKENNLRKLSALVATAAEAGAKLIVLPEMSTTGYSWTDRQEIEEFVEEIPGPTTNLFGELAALYGCHLVLGLPEVEPTTGSFYNSIIFVGPNGLLGKYRKTHLFFADARWAREGDLGFPVFETELGIISGLICQDLMYFEPARILALKGTQVICCPSNWLRSSQPSPMWSIRAFENGVSMICANRAATERETVFHGNSCIIDPDGAIQNVLVDSEGIVYGEVDLAYSGKEFFASNQGHKLGDRRPAEYGILSLNPYAHDSSRVFTDKGRLPLRNQQSLLATVSLRDRGAPRLEQVPQFERILLQATAAAPIPLQLVIFSDPAQDPEMREELAQLIPGPGVECLEDLANRFNLYLVCGMIEKQASNFFRTSILVGPEGLIGKYRQVHLSPTENVWIDEGDLGFPVFDTSFGRVGLLSGYDLLFPESGRCLALAGADLIGVPSSLRIGRSTLSHLQVKGGVGIDGPRDFWRARAGENNTYVAIAECMEPSSTSFRLSAGIFGPNVWRRLPNGNIELKDEAILTLSLIDLDSHYRTNIVRHKQLLAHRQTHWYDEILEFRTSSKVTGATLSTSA